MRMVVLLTVAVFALVGLALVTLGGAGAPEALPAKSPGRSVASSRVFTLLPDGAVEIADARARRVFKWDGQQWVQVDLGHAAALPGGMQ
jgi:hypothetical protein